MARELVKQLEEAEKKNKVRLSELKQRCSSILYFKIKYFY